MSLVKDTNSKAFQDFTLKCTSNSIVTPEAIEDAYNQILALLPANAESAYENGYEAALANFDLWLSNRGADNQKNPANAPAGTETQTGTSMPAASKFSVEQHEAVRNSIQEQQTAMMEMSSKSVITKVLFNMPRQSEYIPKDLKLVIPKESLDKIREYGPQAVTETGHIDPNDTASIEVWNKLVAACENGTPVDIHVSDAYPAPCGVIINHPDTDPGSQQMVTDIMRKDEGAGFLATKAYGYIATNQSSGLGAKLGISLDSDERKRKQAEKKAKKPSMGVSVGKPIMKITGVKRAIENNSFEVISKKVDGSTMTKMVMTEMSFKVATNKFKAGDNGTQGARIYRTVRIRVPYDKYPKFERINETYRQKFGAALRDATITLAPQTPEEINAIMNNLSASRLYLSQNSAAASSFGIGDELKKIVETVNGAKAVTNDAFGE